VNEAERRRLAWPHQQLLVAGQGLGRALSAGPGQNAHLGLADIAGQPGLLGQRQMPENPPQAHPPLGRGHGQVAAGGQPGRRRAGAVGLPRPGGVEGRRGPGGHGQHALQLAVQADHRFAVGENGGINLDQLVDCGGELVHHDGTD